MLGLSKPQPSAGTLALLGAISARLQDWAEHRVRRTIVLSLAGFVAFFLALSPCLGPAAATFGLVPAALAGALLGLRFGVVVAAATFAISIILLALSGYTVGDVVIRLGSGIGLVILMGIAAGFGRMHDLGRQSRRLLAQVQFDRRRLQHILAASPVAIYATDRRGICTFAGGAGLAPVGLSEAMLLGRSFEDFVEEPAFEEGVRRALAGQESRKDIPYHGRHFDVGFAPLLDPSGERGMILVAVDVTETTQTLEALRRSAERTQALLESLPLVVLWVEPSGAISSSEGSGLAAVGLQTGALDGQSILELDSSKKKPVEEAFRGRAATAVIELSGRRVALRFRKLREATYTDGKLGIGLVLSESSIDAQRERVALGELLIERGAITRQQLDEALAEQASQRAKGETLLLEELRNRLEPRSQ